MGGQRLGGDGAAIGDRELGVRARVAQPIAAGNDRFGETASSSLRELGPAVTMCLFWLLRKFDSSPKIH
jgi:hypothetical protein